MFTQRTTLPSLLAMTLVASAAFAAVVATDTDQAFVGKVSQGGLYEVKASQLAESRATSPAVKALARTEVRDHQGVNSRLKRIAVRTGVTIEPGLNAEFQARLAGLAGKTPTEFDAAYLDDMKAIHDKDEKLFAQEALEGSEAYKPFAANTDGIVKRHIAALAAAPAR